MTCKDCHWWHDGCALAFDWDEQPTADSEPCREFDRRVSEDSMDEKVNVEFTRKEYDFIMQYVTASEAVNVQAAILNAVSIALDDGIRVLPDDGK